MPARQFTVMLNGMEACWPSWLFTVAVNVNVPAVVGVPEMMLLSFPVEFWVNTRPEGNCPAVIDQTKGRHPPLLKKLAEYDVPTVPDARVELWLVITNESGGSIAMLSVFVAVSPALSWTWTVNVLVWTVVGVPETTVDMIPKDCAIVSPAGSVPDTIFHVSSDAPPPLFAMMKAE